MASAVALDISVWIGANLDDEIELIDDDTNAPFDLTGSEIIFRALDAEGVQLFRYSSNDANNLAISGDPLNGVIAITMSPEETRIVPLERVAKYEMERRIGVVQEPLIAGYLVGEGGANDD